MTPADGPMNRPANSVGGGLQHERTALAWERTAIAMMVSGVVLARYGAADAHFTLGSVGIAQTAAGGALLLWAGRHDQQLHSLATPASAVPQVQLTRLVGLGTVLFTVMSLILAIVITLTN